MRYFIRFWWRNLFIQITNKVETLDENNQINKETETETKDSVKQYILTCVI